MPKPLKIVAIAAFGTSTALGTLAVTAGTTGTTTVYYACLSGGTLSNVGTAAPTCTARAKQIS